MLSIFDLKHCLKFLKGKINILGPQPQVLNLSSLEDLWAELRRFENKSDPVTGGMVKNSSHLE